MWTVFSNQMPKQCHCNNSQRRADEATFEQDGGISYCLCLTFPFLLLQTAGCNYTLVLMEAADHTEACIPLLFFVGYLFS